MRHHLVEGDFGRLILDVDFGTLSAGDWTFYNCYGGSLELIIVPETSSLILLTAYAVGLLACGRWTM